MVEIENFLNPALCLYLINYYENNQDKSFSFSNRKVLKINEDTKDKVIETIIKAKYLNLHPKCQLSNIEIVKWPIGEYHDWHDDTEHYDRTTITYLNQGYEGGRTQIEDYIVEPIAGKIIMFDSSQKHKVSELLSEVRYVLAVWFNKK